MISTTYTSYIFLAIIAVIYIIIFFLVRKEAREDYRLA